MFLLTEIGDSLLEKMINIILELSLIFGTYFDSDTCIFLKK